MARVYLAGPISGLTHADGVAWRQQVTEALTPSGITCFSPMRGKEYLKAHDVIEDSYPQYVLSTDKGIMRRDHNDVVTADALLVNLLGCKRVTIGTVMEIAWAFDRQIPVVAVMEDKGNCHEHAMIREAIGWRVQTLAEGVACIRSILKHD